jgi:hypothetical protein
MGRRVMAAKKNEGGIQTPLIVTPPRCLVELCVTLAPLYFEEGCLIEICSSAAAANRTRR